MTPLAAALDLGSTRIKIGVLTDNGELTDIHGVEAPPLAGRDLIRECDAGVYIDAARELLAKTLAFLPKDMPVGIASQRSSFLLWNAKSGEPVTPMISWQDRRAHAWCLSHAHYNEKLVSQTGLLLSPHYAGPKLASLLGADKALRHAARAGELRFGTLETYFVWLSTSGAVHTTDLTMGARTLLADPRSGRWAPPWLKAFGVPKILLPRIVPTWGRDVVLDDGGVVTATVADQAAGVVALMTATPRNAGAKTGGGVLVNLGTGGFVTVPTGDKMNFMDGYLSGPLMCGPDGKNQYAIEGTINGIGTTLLQAPEVSVNPSVRDPLPGVFCSPDSSGLGAPYWRAEVPVVISRASASLSPVEHRRVILEGIVFRVTGILKALCGRRLPDSIAMSGGLVSDPFIAQGLANCVQHPVRISDVSEATLLGAARLAAGSALAPGRFRGSCVEPERQSYLPEKFSQWLGWMNKMLAAYPQKPAR